MAAKLLISYLLLSSTLADSVARCTRSEPSKSCGRTLTAYRGWVRSPAYPRPYPTPMSADDRVCTWVISLQQGHGIRIIVYGYDLNSEVTRNSTVRDEVQIFGDGSCSDSRRLRTYTGTSEPTDVVYVPNHLACLKFYRRTNGNDFHSGFTIEYEVVDAYSECGGSKAVKVVSQEGYIYSPGYPFGTNYPPYINCTWVIHAKPGQAIQVNFLDFQLSYSYGCDFATDYLRIGNSNTSYDFTYCDQKYPAPFKSRSNVAWVFFKTGQWRQRGFWLHYKAVGGATASDQPMPDNWSKNVYYSSDGAAGGPKSFQPQENCFSNTRGSVLLVTLTIMTTWSVLKG
ncbi:dorsal-ventral patterning protein tolloid-like [Branchiostoma floridae x Branchiostoma japonicum]